mmetsp:Transcript_103105/g.320696  ORF Transcript_103105/g.320696 Transcript_103105/m.320696 type:complete len:285 (+) Transcript_103105:503-1357(+)
MLLPLKSMRCHRSLSFFWSCMSFLIFCSSSSNWFSDFLLTKCVCVALWPCAARMTLPQCSPETMSESKLGFVSGFTRFRMYAQNSTKSTWPPWLPSMLWNSWEASCGLMCSPRLLSPRVNSLTSIRRSAPESICWKTCHSLLNQKMFSSRAWNSFFSTQSSPSPSTRIVFLYARIRAGLLLSQAGQVPPATISTTILSISARLTTLLPLKSRRFHNALKSSMLLIPSWFSSLSSVMRSCTNLSSEARAAVTLTLLSGRHSLSSSQQTQWPWALAGSSPVSLMKA